MLEDINIVDFSPKSVFFEKLLDHKKESYKVINIIFQRF